MVKAVIKMLRLFFLVSFICYVHGQNYNYYVSLSGNDANDGSYDKPWATLVRAQQQVRTLRYNHGGSLPGPVNLYFFGGVYYQVAVIGLQSGDTGDKDAWVTYTSVPNNSVTFSGGIPIKNWVSVGDNKWVASLPLIRPTQLWIDGKRILPASTEVKNYVQLEYPNKNSDWIQYKPGDIASNYHNLEDVELVLYHSWTASIHKIKSIDTTNNRINLVNPTNGIYDEVASGKRYYLQKVRENLTVGTFYHDSVLQQITYYAQPNEDPNTKVCVVPLYVELMNITGTETNPVQYIKFDSLTFSHSTVDTLNCFTGTCDAQSASFLTTASIHLNFAQSIIFNNVNISHVGGYAMWLENGCRGNSITHSHIWDMGAGGIRIGVPRGGTAPQSLLSYSNTVNDTIIEDGGHFYQMGVGVFMQQTANNIIAHNEIGHLRYTGVSIGWSWGYDQTSNNNNFVGYNLIHDIGEGYLSDMGCVYNLGVSPGTRIYNNICYNVWSYNYGGWGYYTDEGSSYVTVQNNIVYHTKCAGFHQHYGENNLILNNIIAYTADRPNDEPHCNAAVRSSQWAPGSGKGDHSSFTFQRNIVYISDGTLFLSTNIIGFDNMTFDNNVYWSTKTGSNLQFPPTQKPTTFDQWRSEGKDVHSVLADPLFNNPTSYDFRLKSDSPALKLGFVPIDTSQVGPRKGLLQKRFK